MEWRCHRSADPWSPENKEVPCAMARLGLCFWAERRLMALRNCFTCTSLFPVSFHDSVQLLCLGETLHLIYIIFQQSDIYFLFNEELQGKTFFHFEKVGEGYLITPLSGFFFFFLTVSHWGDFTSLPGPKPKQEVRGNLSRVREFQSHRLKIHKSIQDHQN